jgi:HEPN domain-containing protein
MLSRLSRNHKINIPRVHSIEHLYAKIKDHIDLGLELDLIKMLDALYIDSRYPGDFGLMPNGIPDLDDAKQFQELAENVFRDINNCVEG